MSNTILKDSLPAGTRPFDFERDELTVAIHVSRLEDSIFGFSRDLGAASDVKSSGLRLDYDVVQTHSLRNVRQDSFMLTLSASFMGQVAPLHIYTIAGVSADGVLWFAVDGGKYMSASDELAERARLQKAVSGLLGGDIQSFLRDLTEGDEWKNG